MYVLPSGLTGTVQKTSVNFWFSSELMVVVHAFDRSVECIHTMCMRKFLVMDKFDTSM